MTTFFLFGGFLILVLLNIPIAASMGLASICAILSEGMSLTLIPNIMYASIAKNVLLAIPYFVLAGVLMDYAGISKRLIKLAEVCVGHITGGLAVVVVVVACFFAAISGSGPATVAALGGILIPAMKKSGYDENLAGALVAASGGIGVIIPPSIAFVIYAMLAEISVGKLFMAGVLPGILLGVCYIFAAFFSLRKDKNKIISVQKASWKERLDALKDAIWGIITPIIILGGIYGGIFTPTEAAGVAVVYSLFVGIFVYKEIKVKNLWHMFVDSAESSAIVMFILASAGIFAWILTTSGIASHLSEMVMSISSNKYIIILLINILFLIAGCFIEANSAFCIFLPILLPVLREMGYDLCAFGVFMVTSFAVGMITPPVGVNLYVACKVGGLTITGICKKVMPFVITGLLATLLLSYVPQIALFLPTILGM